MLELGASVAQLRHTIMHQCDVGGGEMAVWGMARESTLLMGVEPWSSDRGVSRQLLFVNFVQGISS